MHRDVPSAAPLAPVPNVEALLARREQDSYALTAFGDVVDRSLHAGIARFTASLSPAALARPYMDWLTHLAGAPGKRMQLVNKAIRKGLRLGQWTSRSMLQKDGAQPCIEPLPQDHRFVGEAWQRWPYNFLYQSFLLQQQWWHNATTGVRGVSRQHENAVEFAARQILDMFSPSNFLATNPELHPRRAELFGRLRTPGERQAARRRGSVHRRP
jgi:polyhydroxyalkanoate synthase